MALYQQSFSVFSTYVEVILLDDLVNKGYLGFLHVCGGDPMRMILSPKQLMFSPRMWR